MSDSLSSEKIEAALRAFVQEETGLPFAALIDFAAPLFDAYDVDPARAFALASGTRDEDPQALLLILETARVLWTYSALPPQEATRNLAVLEATLLPGPVNEEERAALLTLLSELDESWHHLTPEERAPSSGSEPLTFAAALARYQSLFPPEEMAEPSMLDETEALALFARPLLEDPGLEDPEVLDRRMELAHALFAIVHLPESERGPLLSMLAERFPEEPDLIRLSQELMDHYMQHGPDAG